MFFSSWNYGSCQSDIAITEWITNPGGSDATDEWMEIFNFGAVSVDIQNWRVEDEDADTGPKRPYFQDPYVLPQIPELKLADPTRLLEKAMERTKRVRSHFRV